MKCPDCHGKVEKLSTWPADPGYVYDEWLCDRCNTFVWTDRADGTLQPRRVSLIDAIQRCIPGLRKVSTDAIRSKTGLRTAAKLSQYDLDPELEAIVARITAAAEYDRPDDLKFEALDASRRLEAWHKAQFSAATDALTKIDLDPPSKELFHAFDHLLRASSTKFSERDHHLEWCLYSWKRFRNALGRRGQREQALWDEMRAMIEALQPKEKPNVD